MAGSERSAFRRPLADRRQSGRRSLGRGKRAKRGAAKRGRRKMSASGMTRREEVRDNPSGRRSPAGVSASSSDRRTGTCRGCRRKRASERQGSSNRSPLSIPQHRLSTRIAALNTIRQCSHVGVYRHSVLAAAASVLRCAVSPRRLDGGNERQGAARGRCVGPRAAAYRGQCEVTRRSSLMEVYERKMAAGNESPGRTGGIKS